MNNDDQLSPDLLQLMQEGDSPTSEDAARVRSRVLRQVGAAAVAGAATSAATKLAAAGSASTSAIGASTGASVGLLTKMLVVVAVGGSLGVGGLVLREKFTKGPEHPAGSVLSPPDLDSHPPILEGAPQVPDVVESKPSDVALKRSGTERSLKRGASASKGGLARKKRPVSSTRGSSGRNEELDRVEPDDSGSSLGAEVQLLRQAHHALQGGDARAAVALLLQHRKKYPRGALSGEREAALTVAYCQGGEPGKGRARAERFIKAYPNSPMVQRLRSVCQLTK